MSLTIDSLLLTLGINSTHLGFRYLRSALTLCLKDEDYLLSVYKRLYIEIAQEHNTTRENVERCIRTVVFNCYHHGNKEFLSEIAMRPLPSKPTNGEFIDILYHYLKAQGK